MLITCLLFPAQFSDVVYLYIYYVNNGSIVFCDGDGSIQQVHRCFELCHYLIDTTFFSYMMTILRDKFTMYKQVIFLLHEDIQRDIYLQLPFIFVPETTQYQYNTLFLNSWIHSNNNHYIEVEDVSYMSTIDNSIAFPTLICFHCLPNTGSIVRIINRYKYVVEQAKPKYPVENYVKHGIERIWLDSDRKNVYTNKYYNHGLEMLLLQDVLKDVLQDVLQT